MGSITYKQYDSRWGSKNYNGSSTMAAAGCGPTSCATVISAHNPKVTPIQTMKFMQEHGYAIRNNGTAWAGIPACLKHFGLEDVREVATMDNLWRYMAQKGCRCIILFGAGTRGGVTWTTSGHFVPATAYKTKGGKHYLWMRDPGPRNKEGWYCYEDHMKGLCKKVWVGVLPGVETVKAEQPSQTKKSKSQKIVDTAKADTPPAGTKRSAVRYPKGKRTAHYKADLKKAYGSRKGWGKQTKAGASCDVFVGTVIRASGVDKKFPRGLDEQIPYLANSAKWKRVKRANHKPGDIIVQKYKSGGKHIMVDIGDGRIANAHYVKKTYPLREKFSKIVKPASKCKMYRVYRAK